MAAELKIAVVAFAADGAASELAAQAMLDGTHHNDPSQLPPVTYENALYGLSLKAPVFRVTGPVVSISDPPHGRKTCRNQPQHGTHTASLGTGYLVNRSLINLYDTGIAGLKLKDVQDVDKQDDGAARRLFHHIALSAMTDGKKDGILHEPEIKDGFHGLFVYLYIFGTFLVALIKS